jgi:hypothetical protein
VTRTLTGKGFRKGPPIIHGRLDLFCGTVVAETDSHPADALHLQQSGQTPLLDPSEARALLDSIDVSTYAGLRDRALIALMV